MMKRVDKSIQFTSLHPLLHPFWFVRSEAWDMAAIVNDATNDVFEELGCQS